MDIRFRPEPPDAVKGVAPVKDQKERDKWKRAQKKADEDSGKKDHRENLAGQDDTAPDQDKADRKPKKDDTGRIVDVLI